MSAAMRDSDRTGVCRARSAGHRMPISEEDLILNDLLSRWHAWACYERTAAGYPSASAWARAFKVSRQYDDENGALDQDVENKIMSGVDGCMNSVKQPWRNALHINARNLSTGLAIWRSPRLPTNELARALLVAEARQMLLEHLRARELI